MSFRKVNIGNFVNTEKTTLSDSLVIFGNTVSGNDIGFLGKRAVNTYSGIIRDQDTNSFLVIESITLSDQNINDINAADPSIQLGNLEVSDIQAETATVTTDPTNDTDVVNKKYVDDTIQTVGVADSAFVVPTGSTAQRSQTPVDGMIRFNTDTGLFEGYHGSTDGWKSFIPAELYLDTSLGRPNPAVQGQIWFNTTTKLFEGYNGTSWDVFIPSEYQET